MTFYGKIELFKPKKNSTMSWTENISSEQMEEAKDT